MLPISLLTTSFCSRRAAKFSRDRQAGANHHAAQQRVDHQLLQQGRPPGSARTGKQASTIMQPVPACMRQCNVSACKQP